MLLKANLLLFAILPAIVSAAITLRQAPNDDTIVYSQFHTDSVIIARYATTTVSSVVLNRASVSQELGFQVQLPETAFISNFTMTINEATYFGVTKSLKSLIQAHQTRDESRGTNVYNLRINIAANSKASFTFTYEELIVRRLSKYQQVINLNPGRLVEDFHARVRAIDEQGIATFGGSDYVQTNRMSSNEVEYTYAPTLEEQNDQTYGLARDMMVEYDVNHPSEGAGLIVVNDCYFAQYFSPSGIERVPVDIVFVIDTSGSMGGRKIEQTRQALETIINNLRSADRFTMVTFDDTVSVWQNRLVSSVEYRQSGIRFARSLAADGGTNFNEGLQTGIRILKDHGNPDFVQLLVMLTDGEPTKGEVNDDPIVNGTISALEGTKILLNFLGLGFNLNNLLLERLVLENNGTLRQIYEDYNTAEQLERFFDEISSPILHTISVSYPQTAIETISQVDFPLLFNGSELVVAGKFSPEVCINKPRSVLFKVKGTGFSSRGFPIVKTFTNKVDPGSNTKIGGQVPPTERLVAYLTLQQLLELRKIADYEDISTIEEEALSLALHYNFVTELTSLIVVEENMASNLLLIRERSNYSGGFGESDVASISCDHYSAIGGPSSLVRSPKAFKPPQSGLASKFRSEVVNYYYHLDTVTSVIKYLLQLITRAAPWLLAVVVLPVSTFNPALAISIAIVAIAMITSILKFNLEESNDNVVETMLGILIFTAKVNFIRFELCYLKGTIKTQVTRGVMAIEILIVFALDEMEELTLLKLVSFTLLQIVLIAMFVILCVVRQLREPLDDPEQSVEMTSDQSHTNTSNMNYNKSDSKLSLKDLEFDGHKFCLYFSGLKECEKSTRKRVRISKDIASVTKIVQSICPDMTKQFIRDCKRIGTYSAHRDRPVCVTFHSQSDMTNVLANKSKLSKSWPGISIKPSMTPEEQETEQILLKQRRDLVKSGVNKSDIKLRGNVLFIDEVKFGYVSESTFFVCSPSASISTSPVTPDASYNVTSSQLLSDAV